MQSFFVGEGVVYILLGPVTPGKWSLGRLWRLYADDTYIGA